MTITALRILCELTFPSETIRLWDGAAPCLDADGEVWSGVTLNEGLDRLESALSGEAATLTLALSGVDQRIGELAYDDLEAGDVIDAGVRILLQPCDERDQPDGDPEVRFAGTIDNLTIEDVASAEAVTSVITIEVANRFVLRNLASGEVLSDVNHRARSAVLNPGAPPDRFAERVSGMQDKVVWWPRFT